MSLFRELWEKLKGKGPAAVVAITLDLGTARSNQPWSVEAGGLVVETCTGDLYARINGPNGDGINLRYVRRIGYPVTSLYLTNTVQSGKSARLLLLSTGMEAETPALGEPILAPGLLGSNTDVPGNQNANVSVASGQLWEPQTIMIYVVTDAPVGTRYPVLRHVGTAGVVSFENSQASGIPESTNRWLLYTIELGQPGEVAPGPGGSYYMNYMPRLELSPPWIVRAFLVNGIATDLLSLYVFGRRKPS